MEIEYSSHFKNSYKKLSVDIQKKAEEAELVFCQNPFSPRLKTHKLHGKLKDFYSFSIDYKFRIVFKFIKDHDKVLFLDVGDHEVYS